MQGLLLPIVIFFLVSLRRGVCSRGPLPTCFKKDLKGKSMLTHAFNLRIWEAGGSVRSQDCLRRPCCKIKQKRSWGYASMI